MVSAKESYAGWRDADNLGDCFCCMADCVWPLGAGGVGGIEFTSAARQSPIKDTKSIYRYYRF